MKILSWPLCAWSIIVLAIVLFAAPAQYEGPVLLPISSGYALSVLDSLALIPLLIGSVWLVGGLWQRRKRLFDTIRLSPSMSSVFVFIAGLGLGLLFASAFSSFFWWWAFGATLFGTVRQVEEPDRVMVHLPKRCRVCGREITANEPYEVVSRRQVFDLPQPRLEVTEHRLGCIECCGQKADGRGARPCAPTVQYGPGVQAWMVKLSVDHKMPLEQICSLFSDLYGYELNSETVERALEEGCALAAPLEAETKDQLKQAGVVHFDETGLRVDGKLQWLHTASNALYTHLFVHQKRGEKALRSESSILPEFTGWAIHDHMAAYYKFTQAKHGACNAHILRELQGLVENGSVWAGAMRAFLLELYGAGCLCHTAQPLCSSACLSTRGRVGSYPCAENRARRKYLAFAENRVGARHF